MRISDWSSDVCSSDLDGTSDLRQAFATVLATGSSYGANHLIDVLLGRRTEKIEMAGHCDVKTFGDRKRVGEGKSVSVRVDLGGRRLIKKKKEQDDSLSNCCADECYGRERAAVY